MTADLARLRELMEMAAPTIEQCHAAGKGPESSPNWTEGGLPNTPDERARFEAYMKGHCWTVGQYDSEMSCYDTTLVRMLYGVWRDRGAVDQAALLSLLTELEQLRAELKHRCACRFTSGGHLKGQLCEYHRRLMNSEIEELANIARQGIGFSREVCAAAILERKK